MKTKAQIVGELLKDGKINTEDAVVLLTPEYYNPYPIWSTPYYATNPIITYGSGVVLTTTSSNGVCNTTDN